MSQAPSAHVRARVADERAVRLDIDLELAAGSVVAVIGPNGAGKSTLLRCIAGLVPMEGDVLLGGRDVTALPPSDRHVGYVPQDGALFPHLTVLDNVAFGLRASGRRRGDARRAALGQLVDLQIADLSDRLPGTLSGGQAQRVALARALAITPDALLLDEPTAALDAEGRAEVQSLLRHRLKSFSGTAVLVTHEAAEALTLADRVLVLQAGRVVQDASPRALVAAPASRWVAALLNLNAWPGAARSDHEVALDDGGVVVVADPPPPGRLLVSVAPTSVTLFTDLPLSSARNSWPMTVSEAHALGDRVRVTLRGGAGSTGPGTLVAEITDDAAESLSIRPGHSVWASAKATDVAVTPS